MTPLAGFAGPVAEGSDGLSGGFMRIRQSKGFGGKVALVIDRSQGVDDPSVPRYDTETLMDAGFGFWLGGVGVLAAVPLDTDEHPLRWFLRLEHRF